MGVSVQLYGTPYSIVNSKLSNPRLGQFLAATWMKEIDPYVPMKKGALSDTSIASPFKIDYNQPYAKAMFYGSQFSFSHEHHPLATAHWDKEAQSAKASKVARMVNAYLKGV